MNGPRKILLSLFAALTLIACDMPLDTAPLPQQTTSTASAPMPELPDRPRTLPREDRAMARAFVAVVNQLEPVAEAECRRRSPRLNCDFLIVVDDRPGVPANAFQTVDDNGRPIIAFTLALIQDARNADELAFVMAHEAAHHIAGHLERQRRNATLGAAVLGELAGATGGDANAIRTAQELGAVVGARSYSKDFELEADRLGAVIATRAGYDALVGAEFFFRVPDPGDRFFGTHPPNAARYEAVRRVVAGL